MTLELYGIVGEDGRFVTRPGQARSYIYEAKEYPQARARAQECGGKVVCFEFECADSYVVEDFGEVTT